MPGMSRDCHTARPAAPKAAPAPDETHWCCLIWNSFNAQAARCQISTPGLFNHADVAKQLLFFSFLVRRPYNV